MQPAVDKHYPWDRSESSEPKLELVELANQKPTSDHSGVQDAVETVEIVRDELESRVELLASVKPFHLFEERWLRAIAGLMTMETYKKDEVVYRAGDRSDATFIVVEGEVAVYTDTIGEAVQLLARVNTGEIFGEVGVLDRCHRNASARATKGARVLRMEATDLRRLGRANPNFGLKLTQHALLRFMRESSKALVVGKRQDVRIRIASPALIVAGDRDPLRIELENLSVGGCCVRGVPEDWHLYESTPLSICGEDGTQLIEARGRIAWRRDESVGIAFTGISRSHGQQIEDALDHFLKAQGDCEAPALAEWEEV